ncbi:hypothetical protein [Nocardia sp. NBC_01327]|uniref:hypothetical protein n=1 Tax=Nocardia sp. NBC_01327 TaxID=2903593 RepID=UPI002E143C22|nr:hypothetical protein OG326_33570 [Nocardia sp. NBC_01327]
MDDGHRWAIETFGEHGPWIRREIRRSVEEEHVASQRAQETSDHRSMRVYGQFYDGIAERFERFGNVLGVPLVRPGHATYRVPVVNGVALFPWRFSSRPDGRIQTTLFATSEARIELTDLQPRPVQGMLDLGLPDPELSDEERSFLATLRAVETDPAVTNGSLVLVAIRSSVKGLHSVEWGEVRLVEGGRLEWFGFHEDLLESPSWEAI